MPLALTPAMLESAYEFLRTTPPFRRWKLPCGEQISFRVSGDKMRAAFCDTEGDEHTIGVSAHHCGWTNTLLISVAHEMVHVYLHRKNVRADHGREFRYCAALVCQHHGFDPKAF
jgi:hypothetical protein